MSWGKSKKDSGKSGKSGKKGKASWKNIGQVNESQHGGHYIKADDYAGDLLFVDRTNGKVYKVLTVGLFEPRKGAPDFVQYNLSINLENEKHCEFKMQDDGLIEERESEESEESEDSSDEG